MWVCESKSGSILFNFTILTIIQRVVLVGAVKHVHRWLLFSWKFSSSEPSIGCSTISGWAADLHSESLLLLPKVIFRIVCYNICITQRLIKIIRLHNVLRFVRYIHSYIIHRLWHNRALGEIICRDQLISV